MIELPPDGLTIADAAVILERAVTVSGALEIACVQDRNSEAMLEQGYITNGEALLLVGTLITLLVHRWPELLDEDTVNHSLAKALLVYSSGNPN